MLLKKIILSLAISSGIFADESYYAMLNSVSLESLGKLQVYTSSRYSSHIDETASVTTVVTEEEIARRGYKTLEELLSKVVGFHSTHTKKSTAMSNRGFLQDTNMNYLYLIDGHAINDKSSGGIGELYIFPILSNVKRVEIVRGPGSTLWGSEALNGIVHIITKNAQDVDGSDGVTGSLHASFDKEYIDNREIIKLSYAKRDKDFMLDISGVYFDSSTKNGFFMKQAGTTAPIEPILGRVSEYDYRPSYNFYLKSSYKDFKVKLLYIDFNHQNGEHSNEYTEATKEYHKKYIELSYRYGLADNLSLVTRVYYDNFTNIADAVSTYPATTNHPGTTRYGNISNQDKGFGAETILHHTLEDNNLLFGLFYENKYVTSDYNSTLEPYRDYSIQGKSIKISAFIEDTYSITQDLKLTLGYRAEKSELVNKETFHLPRASLYYKINDNFFSKYSYNTGAVNPTLKQQTSRPYYNRVHILRGEVAAVDKPQTSKTHDIQVGYHDGKLDILTTLYCTDIYNLIMTIDERFQLPDRSLLVFEDHSFNDLNQQGFELEFKYKILQELSIYGNYSYAKSKFKNRTMLIDGEEVDIVEFFTYARDDLQANGVPKQSWNLGVNFDITKDIAINLHYKGWNQLYTKYQRDRRATTWYEKSSTENFVDLNLRWQNFIVKNAEISIYAKNLSDNYEEIPTRDGDLTSQLNRKYGFKFTYKY